MLRYCARSKTPPGLPGAAAGGEAERGTRWRRSRALRLMGFSAPAAAVLFICMPQAPPPSEQRQERHFSVPQPPSSSSSAVRAEAPPGGTAIVPAPANGPHSQWDGGAGLSGVRRFEGDFDPARHCTTEAVVEMHMPILRRLAAERGAVYRQQNPFPYLVADGVFDARVLREAVREVVADYRSNATGHWDHFLRPQYEFRKSGCTNPSAIGPCTRAMEDFFMSPDFIDVMNNITGLGDLARDPTHTGGGLHYIECPGPHQRQLDTFTLVRGAQESKGSAQHSQKGGYLGVHLDFTVDPAMPGHWRRVNQLLYLNEGWQEAWGGHAEIWGISPGHDQRDFRAISKQGQFAPVFNRLLLFTAGQNSWHGHPDALDCPPGDARKSFANYYFSKQQPTPHFPYHNAAWGQKHSTVWLEQERQPRGRNFMRSLEKVYRVSKDPFEKSDAKMMLRILSSPGAQGR
eukprot:TRINITY_DN51345_c0_g1_i1.p1 TRINITY_DN51345_c0_g1~~TRINITY_DN51345_c0_g1_i1.p1  ORF type:complete len:459 (+),score=119.41 TRINITY_DN51345_c0_g1_i1:90-1466(+)